MTSRFNMITAASALLLAVAGCNRDTSESAIKSKVFIPPEARAIKVFRDGTDVTFAFEESYPAERLRLLIDNAYHPPDWRQVDELVMFPGRRTSEWSVGWMDYLQDGNQVHRWIANWKHQDGRVVMYIITYRWPERLESDPSAIATVEGILFPPGNGQTGAPPPR